MKLKIVNKGKFIRGIVTILGIILATLILVSNKSLSHGEVKYGSIYVKHGDTLWSIAENEQRNNPYYDGKDVRYIIASIKNLNDLSDSSLIEGQKLLIMNI